MAQVQEDGATRRQHLESWQRQRGAPVAELIGPKLPKQLEYLWGYFMDLWPNRSGGGAMGPTFMTNRDILDWAQGMKISLLSWEFSTLRQLGITAVDALHSKEAPKQQKGGNQA